MRPFVLAGLVALLAAGIAAGSAPAHGQRLSRWVTLDGDGGVVPGMSAARVRREWGIRVPPATKACAISRFEVGRLRGYALFLHGRFGSVFFDRGAVTPSGIRIGSPRSLLVERYGKALRGVPGGASYFLARAAAPHWQLRFDLNAARRVVLIAFGDASVHISGGC